MLVAQGHTQEEGIDYDEVFTPVARIEAIRLFLAYASFMGFTVYQMDVKSAFYGIIDEEVLQFCDYHNMVAILEKSEQNADFHPIVNFIEASPLRIHVEEELQIMIDGLDISNETVAKYLQEYHQFATELPLERRIELISDLVKYQDNYAKGEGSGTPTEPHHTPSQEAQPSSPTHISISSIPTVIPIPTVTQYEPTLLRQYTRRVRIAQSSALPPVADEPASPMRDVSERKACPTDSGFIADRDKATIAKSSTLPHDTAQWVTSSAVITGSMQQTINELTALCTNLQRQHSELLVQFQAQKLEINKLNARVKILEDNQGVIGAKSTDDAPIKGRRIDEEEGITGRVSSDTEEIRMDEGEVADERTSEDTKEMATVLTSMDVATVLAGGIDVPTGSYSIPTAGPPAVDIHTGSDAVPTTKEQQEREDKRMTEQISRDAKVARIHAEEELQESTEKTMVQKAKEGLLYDCDQKQLRVEDFNPMGSKEEAERLKRKGFNLEQEKAKKQKTSEEVPDKEMSPEEILEEKVKEMMQLVPIEEVQRDLHASREGQSSEEWSSPYDDLLQASG
nr:copia protein [Tanacetum cinerariifolium]